MVSLLPYLPQRNAKFKTPELSLRAWMVTLQVIQ